MSSVTLLDRSHPIAFRPPAQLRPAPRNPRTHSKKQIQQIARSIQRFGFTNPVLISDEDEIIAGHGRVEAAKQLGLAEIPTLRLSRLSPAERRAYLLADNKLALNAGWDRELLAIELQGLAELDFEVELTGFSVAEIDLILEEARDSSPDARDAPEDRAPPLPAPAATVTRPGDLWELGRHRLLCADAREASAYQALVGAEPIDLIFTDPPYNVPIDGHVSGLGRVQHREFAMASGEMTPEAFTHFLTQTLGHAARACKDGAIAFVCMDWRHMGELLSAGQTVFSELKNLCVWNKTNAGMGSFYRSKHELVFVFKVGTGAHTNSFGLGETGRHRTNVWDYAGATSFRAERQEELALHPTVKPVALVADALRDCSRRGERVLDPFGGSGTTLIAAEKTGRRARLLEVDPAYCDVILRRFEQVTGRAARLAGCGMRFEDVAAERGAAGLVEAGR
ncbi:site-specific DNA-methyltransferase [Methylobacterium oryzisoli]|uniref:site-specific DNA-methyltransferase n=1 Tax=Methylobacterium oryzisoli TaxID=3385502 RepID=UPI0038924BCB